MKTKDLFLDKISNLPLSIIEDILCLVPIKEAVRTSILSKDWRYNWTKIPKLAFSEKDMFDESSDDDGATYVFFNAIRQVLLLHQGPMFEFIISMEYAKAKCDEIDQIIMLLARNKDTLKKLTLDLSETCDLELELPLSIYSLNQLSDLYISGFVFEDDSTSRGFDSLTTLYVHGETKSEVSLFNLLSNCPLLKHFELEEGDHNWDEESSIIELFKCLPAIEHLAFDSLSIERDRVPVELPTKLVHLKYFCLNLTILIDNFGLGQLGFVIKNSPNLEKIKLEIIGFNNADDGTNLVTLKNCSDIRLAHLKKLEIVAFAARKGEMEFVKLILAKSPILMKVRIILSNEEVTKDEESEIVRILLGSPCASRLAEITVERQAIATSYFSCGCGVIYLVSFLGFWSLYVDMTIQMQLLCLRDSRWITLDPIVLPISHLDIN
ncbi:F-box/FBD/LRR-repeat protein-like protein [Tanacetum coccineum]